MRSLFSDNNEIVFNFKLTPILKWQGGKRKILRTISKYYPKYFNDYIEVFSGMCAVFTDLVNKQIIRKNTHILLNDINRDVILLFEHIKENVDIFKEKLLKYKNGITRIEYHDIKKTFNDYVYSLDYSVDRSVLFYVIISHNFNGSIRYNKRNGYNAQYGRQAILSDNKIKEIDNLSICLKNPNIFLSNNNYIDLLETYQYKKNDFFYFDPPYYPESNERKTTQYNGSSFTDIDQIKLMEYFKKIDNMDNFVLLSNSKTDFIRNLYSDYKIIEVDIYRGLCADKKYRIKTQEYLILGNYLYNSIKK